MTGGPDVPDYSRPSVDAERRVDAESHRMPPAGEPTPTTQELMTSGGATMEEVQRRSPHRATEVFVDFDHRHLAAGDSPPFMYSYGERVAVDVVDSFGPFVRRAESNARAHHATSSQWSST
jgi:hypothetical protein